MLSRSRHTYQISGTLLFFVVFLVFAISSSGSGKQRTSGHHNSQQGVLLSANKDIDLSIPLTFPDLLKKSSSSSYNFTCQNSTEQQRLNCQDLKLDVSIYAAGKVRNTFIPVTVWKSFYMLASRNSGDCPLSC